MNFSTISKNIYDYILNEYEIQININKIKRILDDNISEKLKIIDSDILDFNNHNDFIVQQNNCTSKKYKGLSGDLKRKYNCYVYSPDIRRVYKQILIFNYNDKYMEPNSPNIICLFSQINPGKPNCNNNAEDRLNAFEICLNKALIHLHKLKLKTINVYFPYKIGCGLAGGDWSKYYKLIQEFSKKCNDNICVYICKNTK